MAGLVKIDPSVAIGLGVALTFGFWLAQVGFCAQVFYASTLTSL